MTYQLSIHCRKQNDVMERVLRVIRHRGFVLQGVNMTMSSCGKQLELSVAVDSHRPIHLLTSQLEKLHDVLQWRGDKSTIQYSQVARLNYTSSLFQYEMSLKQRAVSNME